MTGSLSGSCLTGLMTETRTALTWSDRGLVGFLSGNPSMFFSRKKTPSRPVSGEGLTSSPDGGSLGERGGNAGEPEARRHSEAWGGGWGWRIFSADGGLTRMVGGGRTLETTLSERDSLEDSDRGRNSSSLEGSTSLLVFPPKPLTISRSA